MNTPERDLVSAAAMRPIPLAVGALLRRSMVAILLMLGLAGCSVVDPVTRDACLMVLPAIERPEARVIVLAVDALPRRPADVRVRYRVEGPGGWARVTETICAFGDEFGSGNRRTLLGVRTDHGDLGPARLYFLKRFWLGDPRAAGEAAARIRFDETVVAKGIVSLPPMVAVAVQWMIEAIVPSAVYALLGLACALIWGLVGRVGSSFRDVAVLSAFSVALAVVGLDGTGIGAAGLLAAAGAFCAVAVATLCGTVFGRILSTTPAAGSGRSLLAAVVCLSIAVEGLLTRTEGTGSRFSRLLFDGSLVIADGVFPVTVTPLRLIVAVTVAALVGVILATWSKTRLGLAWRAVADDREAARRIGVEPGPVVIGSFAVAAVLAVAAGVLLTLAFGGASFAMGSLFGLGAMVAAIAGGIGSLPGAALGGLLLGLGETLWSAAFGDEWRNVGVLLALAAIAVSRPAGLLGTGTAPGKAGPRG